MEEDCRRVPPQKQNNSIRLVKSKLMCFSNFHPQLSILVIPFHHVEVMLWQNSRNKWKEEGHFWPKHSPTRTSVLLRDTCSSKQAFKSNSNNYHRQQGVTRLKCVPRESQPSTIHRLLRSPQHSCLDSLRSSQILLEQSSRILKVSNQDKPK